MISASTKSDKVRENAVIKLNLVSGGFSNIILCSYCDSVAFAYVFHHLYILFSYGYNFNFSTNVFTYLLDFFCAIQQAMMMAKS